MGSFEVSERQPGTTNEPEWTDAEHDEIMRLHIIEGYTISEAKLVVFERRETVNV